MRDQLKNKSMIVRAYSDADWSKEYHGHSIAGRAIEVGAGFSRIRPNTKCRLRARVYQVKKPHNSSITQ